MKLLFVFVLMTFCNASRIRRGEPDINNINGTSVLKLRMPGYSPVKNDDYVCYAQKMGHQDLFITHYKVEGTAERAHHMILYGCSAVAIENTPWDCGHHAICTQGQSILFAWAKNAPPTSLPPSVGFQIGGSSSVKYVVLQIHYAHPLAQGEKDYSGLDAEITSEKPKYIAGIHLMVSQSLIIPPYKPKVYGDINCQVHSSTPIYLFAFRTHAHALGRVITGYRYSKKNNKIEEIARGNPQWPQAFYSMDHVYEVERGDVLFARCTFNSTLKNTTTYIGSTAGDEMCNLYLMYYTDAERGSSYGLCVDQQIPGASDALLPSNSDEPLPPNPFLEEHALHGHSNVESNASVIVISNKTAINLEGIDYNSLFSKEGSNNGYVPLPDKKDEYQPNEGVNHVHKKPLQQNSDDVYNNHYYDNTQSDYDSKFVAAQENLPQKTYPDNYRIDQQWPMSMVSQPSAVAIDSKGNVIVFHRGNRAWGQHTFGMDNRLTNNQEGPIKDPTLLLLDFSTGHVLNQAGGNMFFLPHGLTVDANDNLWITDVGAHQVFKLTPLSEKASSVQVLLELGKQLQPGSDDKHFCKPTSVAVLPNGEFFVADGYCNSRIIKFNKIGIKIFEWGERLQSFAGSFGSGVPQNMMNIPHSLTLVPEKNMVCVADRENARILCISATDGQFQMQIKFPEFGSEVFAIAHDSGNMYAVNAPIFNSNPARGFVIDMKNEPVISSVFATKANFHLGQPHWLSISPNGTSIFIAEINPYRIVKLVRESDGQSNPVPDSGSQVNNMISGKSDPEPKSIEVIGELENFPMSTSMIIISLLMVPLLIIIIVVSVTRIRKRGCCSSKSNSNSRLDLGNLLGRRDPIRGGFEKLAMDDSDVDGGDSDSETEVVEFSKTKKSNHLSA